MSEPAPEFHNHASEMPRVAMPARPWVMPLALLGAVSLGGIVFLSLALGRTRVAEAAETPAPAHSAPANAAPQHRVAPILQVASSPPPNVNAAAQNDEAARLSSRAMVVDLTEAPAAAPESSPPNGAASSHDANAAINPSDAFGQGSNELFVSRLSHSADGAHATPPGDLSNIVPEGTLIPAVLETALNSDLPGYTRAIVSRDVLSFDGSKVLVPRGTRLIGQYRSAVALGQSRAFVVWTRLVRPDGVSVQIADPGADALGRGGLEGAVDTHFVRRFGGAILLTLLNAGAAAASNNANTAIIIAGAQGFGAQTGQQTDNIAPTVEVPQGAPVRIFVTRDLDFSDVSSPQ